MNSWKLRINRAKETFRSEAKITFVFTLFEMRLFRTCCLEAFRKTAALKCSPKFTANHICWRKSIFNKVVGLLLETF